MMVTDQINALRALGTDPIRKLVVPRVLAGFLMAPVLTVISDFVGIIGGWIVAALPAAGRQRASTGRRSRKALYMQDVWMGLIKPFVLGFVIVTIALPRRPADAAAARRASARRRPWPSSPGRWR